MGRSKSFKGVTFSDMKEFLEEKHDLFNNPGFITNDPVSIPHCYSARQDIEISAFLTATIAWGRRDLIISSASSLMNMMGDSPYSFLTEASDLQLDKFSSFYYRTFNGTDCSFFIRSLRNIYHTYDSIEDILVEGFSKGNGLPGSISYFREVFFGIPYSSRSGKHFADIGRGAAAKRLNMFLRWMVRRDGRGVDFGLWDRIEMSDLYIPLDLHSGNTARKLGLLKRSANDWKSVEELTSVLRLFDRADPVKYDFALFGLGVNEKF